VVDGSGNWTYTLSSANITTVGQGTGKVVSVTEVDAAGNPSASAATRTITIDTVAPSNELATTAAPILDVLAVGQTVTFQVDWNEALVVTGTPRLLLSNGAYATYDASQTNLGTGSLAFKYTVASTDNNTASLTVTANSIELSGGTIKDAAGNDASLTNGDISYTTAGLSVNTIAPTHELATTATPTTDAMKVGEAVTFKVDWNDALVVTGTPKLLLSNGAYATYDASQTNLGTGSLAFKYTVASTDTNTASLTVADDSIRLNGGTKDAAGNDASLTNGDISYTAAGLSVDSHIGRVTISGDPVVYETITAAPNGLLSATF